MPGQSSFGTAPHCYRHPDRETYISCTRCGRPICPDCMISASVGFQCPECVAEGRATQRMPTTAAGAPIGERPIVSMVLVGICVVVFALEFLIGVDQVTGRFGMYPPDIALNGEIWRLPTSMFLHGNLLHIGFNMLVLWTIGPQVERILGHGRFLVLYLVAGLGGAVASYAFSAPLTLSVGASGAIFGVMGALVVAGRQVGFDVRQVLILIGINVAIGFVGGGIDWRAHLGGLATGAAVAAVMVYAPRASRLLWQTLGVLAILGLLVMITMWRTAELHAMLDAIPGIPA